VAKKNYTQAGARRAISAIHKKGSKLMIDQYITPQDMIKLHDWCTKMQRKLK